MNEETKTQKEQTGKHEPHVVYEKDSPIMVLRNKRVRYGPHLDQYLAHTNSMCQYNICGVSSGGCDGVFL